MTRSSLLRRSQPSMRELETAEALPEVTVLMPVFNGTRYVAEAIESILAQTHPNFEFLIVDDGSTDATPEILAAYAARDARIRLVRHENKGQAASLNRGLELARHDWVAIIDHDDVSLPQRLEGQLALVVRQPTVVVVGSYVVEIDAMGLEMGRWRFGPTTRAEFWALRQKNERIYVIHPSVMMHRPTILKLGGYNPAFGASADSELWSRVADDHLILTIPQELVQYRLHQDSMTMTHFFEQKCMGRWIVARQDARRRGLPVPSFEACMRYERGPLGLRLLVHRRRDWLRYCVRARRLARTERRRIDATRLAVLMFLLDPFVFGRSLRARIRRTRVAVAAESLGPTSGG